LPIDVTELAIPVTLESELHPMKRESGISGVTPVLTTAVVRFVQLRKAPVPIDRTEFGIVT
jgi:hypothetical protein